MLICNIDFCNVSWVELNLSPTFLSREVNSSLSYITCGWFLQVSTSHGSQFYCSCKPTGIPYSTSYVQRITGEAHKAICMIWLVRGQILGSKDYDIVLLRCNLFNDKWSNDPRAPLLKFHNR